MAKALDPKSRDISIEGLMKGPERSIQTLVLATKKFQTFVLNFLSRKKIGTCSKIFPDVMAAMLCCCDAMMLQGCDAVML